MQFTSGGLLGAEQLRFTIAGSAPQSNQSSEEYVLVESPQAKTEQRNIVGQLEGLLGKSSTRVTWGSKLPTLEGKACIILTDLESAILRDISRDDFEYLQQIVTGSEKILWVSGVTGPDRSLIAGLARTIRNESAGQQFDVLEIDNPPTEALPELINRIRQASTEDSHFRAVNGQLCISRILEDETRNEALATGLGQIDPKMTQLALKDAPGPLKLCVKNPGMLDSLCFESDDKPSLPLDDDMVEVDVKASGIKYVVLFPLILSD